MIPINDRLSIPEDEIEWSYSRSGGPGGQNVNKVASKVQLRWRMAPSTAIPEFAKERFRILFPSRCTQEGDVLVVSQRYRDQERNREDCVVKLGEMVRASLRTPTPRKATKPTRGSKLRRLDAKKKQSGKKQLRRPAEHE